MEVRLAPALALHPKSFRQIGEALFFFNELRKCVRTFHGRFVYCGNGEGIEALAKPIFVRAQPFNGSGTAVPFYGWHAPCLAGMSHARTLRLIVRGGKELIIA